MRRVRQHLISMTIHGVARKWYCLPCARCRTVHTAEGAACAPPRFLKSILATCALCVLIAPLIGALEYGQESPVDRLSVPFSDPSRPRLVKASLLNGGITVKGYEGKDVVVEARARGRDSSPREKPVKRTEGLRRLENTSTGLNVEEEDNVVSVDVGSINRPIDLVIQVPVSTSLKLGCVNDGDITVERVSGVIEVDNINGAVTLSDVSGAVLAHALNKDVKVTLVKVTPDKPMSFSSLSGDIDVTFPPDVKAKVNLKSDNGEIYSDFEIRLDPAARQPVVEEARGKGGKYRVRIENALNGVINGGGPEMQFKTFNGNIYLRKGQK
jgi:hypothetical protein